MAEIGVHWDSGFHEAAERGAFTMQRCRRCGHTQHYPRPACGSCLERDFEWVALSGAGFVYTFTVVHRPNDPNKRSNAPYVLLDVQLDDGPRFIARLADESEQELVSIGARVTTVFQKEASGRVLPFVHVAEPEAEAK